MATLTTRLLTLSSLEVDSLQTQEVDLALLVKHLRALTEATRERKSLEEMQLPPIPPAVAKRVRAAFQAAHESR